MSTTKHTKQPFSTPTKCLTYKIILFVLLVCWLSLLYILNRKAISSVRLWLETKKNKTVNQFGKKTSIVRERKKEKEKKEEENTHKNRSDKNELCECQWSLIWTNRYGCNLKAHTYTHIKITTVATVNRMFGHWLNNIIVTVRQLEVYAT